MSIKHKTTFQEVESILLSADSKGVLEALVRKNHACKVQDEQKGGNYLVEMEKIDEGPDAMSHNGMLYMRNLGIFTHIFSVPIFCMCTFTKRPMFRFWFPLAGQVLYTEWRSTVTGAYHDFLVATNRSDKLQTSFQPKRKFPFKKHQAFILQHYTPQILAQIQKKILENPERETAELMQDLLVVKYIAEHFLGYTHETVKKLLLYFDVRLAVTQTPEKFCDVQRELQGMMDVVDV